MGEMAKESKDNVCQENRRQPRLSSVNCLRSDSPVQVKGQFLRKNCHIDSLEAFDSYPDWTVPNPLLDKDTELVA